MEISKLFGLPAHPLIVHAAVVLIPLVGLAALVMAASRRARDRIGWITTGLAFVAFLSAVVAEGSGEELEHSVERSSQLHTHTELGETMPALAFLLFAVVLAMMLVHHFTRTESDAEALPRQRWKVPTFVAPLVAVVMAITAVGVTAQLIRVGHSGAKASWGDVQMKSGGEGERDDDGD